MTKDLKNETNSDSKKESLSEKIIEKIMENPGETLKKIENSEEVFQKNNVLLEEYQEKWTDLNKILVERLEKQNNK